jgi:hypothetical protein
MDKATHHPTVMKEEDAWHLCAITVECAGVMASEERRESTPPHANAEQLCEPPAAQSKHAINAALWVGNGRHIAEPVASSKGTKRLRTAHVYEGDPGAVFLNTLPIRGEICKRFTAEAAA